MVNEFIRQLFHLNPTITMYYSVKKDGSLLDILENMFPESSRFSLYSWIKQERIIIDGRIISSTDAWVNAEQIIKVNPRETTYNRRLKVIYQDNHLLIVDKSAGLPSLSHKDTINPTAHSYLMQLFPSQNIYPVYTLNSETSGIMVFAFNKTACEVLKEAFHNQDLEHSYTAIVEGRIKERTGTWEEPLELKSSPLDTSDLAITHYGTIGSSRHYSWLNLTLENMEYNHIRRHCCRAGYPIVGDIANGASTNPIKRLCLHAHRLALNHPITDKSLLFEASVPKDFFEIITPSLNHPESLLR